VHGGGGRQRIQWSEVDCCLGIRRKARC
jgi:hypothetical protein